MVEFLTSVPDFISDMFIFVEKIFTYKGFNV